ncbi:hypothetical protein [Nostoc sp. 'Peltigera membranacea cyanobiont' 210A]|uniref:hypothetical protein n=1 Tax=Nostoc sp. 'Peltigera membranacea cyanobiont' 210A TaxID=2014529 RepID=UPI001CB928F3|nr:hypothetical protein [Nostoc sp. 'Peltigera membranacea cyanobiont' 210A]
MNRLFSIAIATLRYQVRRYQFLLLNLDFSLVRNPRGVGGWGRSLTPHTPHTPHTPLPPLLTLCVRNPG